jgi:hypothetical protein
LLRNRLAGFKFEVFVYPGFVGKVACPVLSRASRNRWAGNGGDSLSETPLTHCGIVPLNLTIQECRIVQQTDPLCSCHLLLSMCIVRKVTGTDPLNLTIQECRIVQQTDPLCSCHLVLSMCSVRKVTETDILTLDGFVTGGPPFCCSIVPGRIAAVASQRQGRCSWGKHGGRGLRYTNSLHNEGGIVCVNANLTQNSS